MDSISFSLQIHPLLFSTLFVTWEPSLYRSQYQAPLPTGFWLGLGNREPCRLWEEEERAGHLQTLLPPMGCCIPKEDSRQASLYSGSEMVAEPEIPLLLAPEHCIISCGCPNPIPTFTNSPFIKFLSNYPNSSVPSVPSWNPGSYNAQDVAYSSTYKWSHSLNAIFFRETSLTPILLCYSICLISFIELVTSWCCH